MVTYEITATVRPDLTETYERYMRESHVPDVLATGSFTRAAMARSGPGRYRIWYQAKDQQTLDRYVANHAPRLRADLVQHFPAGVELAREIWSEMQDWSPPR